MSAVTELYVFNYNGQTFGFVPKVLPDTSLGFTCYPAFVKRGKISISGNLAKSSVEFTFDKFNTFAKMVFNTISESIITIIIYRNGSIYWRGRVVSSKMNFLTFSIVCDNKTMTKNTTAFFPKFTLHCSHQVYDQNCRLVKENNAYPYNVVSVNSNIFSVTGLSQASGFFNGGFASINGQSRRIVSQVGTTVTINYPFIGVQTGSLRLYPGCMLNRSDCSTKFNINNLDNYGGFLYTPPKNPFEPGGAF